jgi:hypothetical protein
MSYSGDRFLVVLNAPRPPPLRQPCHLWGPGHLRFIWSTGIPDPWVHNTIANGAP